MIYVDKMGRTRKQTARTKEEWLAAITHDKKSYSGKPYDYSLLPDYVPSNSRITFVCPDHGEFTVFAHSHLIHGCRECAKHRQADTRRGRPSHRKMTLKQVLARAKKLHPNIDFSNIDKTSYTTNKDVWNVRCKIHNTTKQVKVINLLWHGGSGCDECIREDKKRQNKQASIDKRWRFDQVAEAHGYKIKSYTRAHQPAKLVCPNHGDFVVKKAYYINEGYRCPKCKTPEARSQAEDLLYKELNRVGLLGEIQLNQKLVSGTASEADLLIPKHQLAIELNGVYWHSERYKDSMYHARKTDLFEAFGYSLLHFSDTELYTKMPLVVSMIHAKCGIFKHRLAGRQTAIHDITFAEAKEFLQDNHIQGPASGSAYYGLSTILHNKEVLVAVAVFGKPRFSKKYDYELIRFATRRTCQVHGALSKFIAHFSKSHSGTLVSYADRNYSSGNAYANSGWTFVQKTKPSYTWYSLGRKYSIVSRYQSQKHNLVNILDNFNPDLSERENMEANRYVRVFNSGNLVYVRSI